MEVYETQDFIRLEGRGVEYSMIHVQSLFAKSAYSAPREIEGGPNIDACGVWSGRVESS